MSMSREEAIRDIEECVIPYVGGISLRMAVEDMKAMDRLSKENTKNVAYLCKEHGEGNTCPRDGSTCSYNVCKHTTDVRYAKNFVQIDDDKYAEIDEQQNIEWGKWVISEVRCPECLEYFDPEGFSKEEMDTCPNCGANMRKGNPKNG